MPRGDVGVPTPGVERSNRAGPIPDRLYVVAPGLDAEHAQRLADAAVRYAQAISPKLSGRMARNLLPVSGTGFFGIRWLDNYTWFQESGIGAFTMRNLAGKTIPMWVDDPTGTEAQKNPKAKTRITESGKRQVLIFRRVGKIGARKFVRRSGVMTSVPQSYPGAPGRIAQREYLAYPGRSTGRIARVAWRPNIGVRWRYPGLQGRFFLHRALEATAKANGIVPRIHADRRA